MIHESSANGARGASGGVREGEIIGASREFLTESVASTPMRRYTGLFEPDASATAAALDECIVEGFEAFRSDAWRWKWSTESPSTVFDRLRLAPNLEVPYFYRVSHALFSRRMELVPDVLAAVSRFLTGVEIYYSARIGPGLKVIHGLGTVIGARCVIGSCFTVYQGVTIGDKLGRDTGERPVIGDHVIASAGSQILGPVRIGSHTIVGANAVVLESLPERCIAGGVPAGVKRRDLSEAEFEEYWRAVEG